VPTIEGGVKYLLRGLVFIVYFPIQLLFRLVYFLWFYFMIKPLTWIWETIFLPIFQLISGYLLYPFWKYMIRRPIQWVWRQVLFPVIRKVLFPLCRFCWNYLIYPFVY